MNEMNEDVKTGGLDRRGMLKAGLTAAAATGAIAVGAMASSITKAGAQARSNHELIASCWIHMGATIPFSGRMWSSVPFAHRAKHVAQAGFKGMGLFHDDIAHILEFEAPGATNAKKFEWMKGVLDENGLTTNEIEFLVNWMFPKGDARRDAEAPVREMLLQAAGILKPRNLKCGNLGHPVSVEVANQGFRELCAEFKSSGVKVCMEILPPDPNGQTLESALRVVAGADNGGIFLDTWHVNNIPGITYDAISKLKPGQIAGIELDDGWYMEKDYAPWTTRMGSPGFIEMTVNCRKCLGEGNFDVLGFIRAVIASGYRGPWGNEILSEELRRFPMEVAVRHVFKSSIPYVRAGVDGVPLQRFVTASKT
jgi:sugar phosphate isomerase/epimerase